MIPQTEQRIAQLIFLELQGLSSQAQKEELEAWRFASSRHEEIYLRLKRQAYWEENYRRFVKTATEHEKGWQQLSDRVGIADRKMAWNKWLACAAAVVVLVLGIGIAIFYYSDRGALPAMPVAETTSDIQRPEAGVILTLADGTEIDLKSEAERLVLGSQNQSHLVDDKTLSYRIPSDKKPEEEYNTLAIPRGGEYMLVLSDGSKVYLNAESKLTFPVRFAGKERKVYLEGEAYFQVAKNPEQPFVVEVAPLKVEVTGTTFGVRAYREERDIQTTLESGKVNVWAGAKKVELSPSKQALFNKSTTRMEVRVVNTELFLSWKDGRLVFDNCPLEQILTELSRWYAFEVSYNSPELKKLNFSLNMQKHAAFREVLDLIAATGEIGFEIKDETVIVK